MAGIVLTSVKLGYSLSVNGLGLPTLSDGLLVAEIVAFLVPCSFFTSLMNLSRLITCSGLVSSGSTGCSV